MKNILEKSIGEILADLRKEVEMGIWESEEEAVSEYKMRREKKTKEIKTLLNKRFKYFKYINKN